MAKTLWDDFEEDTDEITNLVKEIEKHNKAYWIDHKPIISDIEYDKLIEKLKKLSPNHPALSALVEDSNGKKIKHLAPMLSLDKVFTADDVQKWMTTNDIKSMVSTYKIDGLSCSLIYKKGKLTLAATRGDGETGDNITANVLAIDSIPKTIPFTDERLEIRGEIYMSKQTFKYHLEQFEKKLKQGLVKEDDRPSNARNYAAGSLKQKDAEITRQRSLSFMAYIIVGYEEKIKTEYQLHSILKKMGFSTPYFGTATNNIDEIKKVIDSINTERTKATFGTDGIVFADDDRIHQKSLGATSHHPKGKIAFKFGREQGETTITDIHWNTSRTGNVVPQIELKPIDLGGATVTFCTGHNAKNIKENKLAIGSVVLMEREVIPYLVKKVSGSNNVNLPSVCPTCNTKLIWDETETQLCCTNSACPAQLIETIKHYVSKKCTNMVGIGDEIIEKLIENKLIKSPADLFTLTKSDILRLDRQGESSAENIINAIQSRKKQDAQMFLTSLCISGLGETVSERLVKRFGTLDKVLTATKAELLTVENVADKTADSILDGFETCSKTIKDLLKHIEIIEKKAVQGKLTGYSFCLTGHIEFDYNGKHYDSRPNIEDLIKEQGGVIKSVSKSLNYLVVGTDAGDKVNKAQKAGVKCIDTNQFVKMIG